MGAGTGVNMRTVGQHLPGRYVGTALTELFTDTVADIVVDLAGVDGNKNNAVIAVVHHQRGSGQRIENAYGNAGMRLTENLYRSFCSDITGSQPSFRTPIAIPLETMSPDRREGEGLIHLPGRCVITFLRRAP